MRSARVLPILLMIAAGAASAEPLRETVVPVAQPFPLNEVRLLDSPFKRAMERNADYLLSLDPDRLLHNTRQYAGLAPKGPLYGGWESAGIAGHTLGHYLSALSLQYEATGDERFKKRIDYIISEMAVCQRAYGDGYIGALPPVELATLRGFKEGHVAVQGPFNFATGAWVPWYTEHKVLNGLKDAWVHGGNAQAREVTLKLADWIDSVTANLSQDQLQTMLQVEQGGMVDVLVELYALTGSRRYLETSRRFYHHAVMDPLLARRDELPGKHANTQIPKVIGAARTYEVTGEPDGRAQAEYFWDLIAHHYSYAIGGNSENEHLFPENTMAEHLGPNTAETCNTYNMLKLTEHVFSWKPTVDYADFYERALYNHILASQEPRKGMFTYFVSLEPGLFRTYSTPFDSFWCCVGTGMENHTKYGEAIYYHGSDDLYVNLFIPSELDWKQREFGVTQTTDYPRENITRLTITRADSEPLAIHVRCPGWAAGAVTFTLNGARLGIPGTPGTFATVGRVWRTGDVLTAAIPMAVRTEAAHGDPNKVAFLYGPVVLAGDLGPEPVSPTIPYAERQDANLRVPPVPVPILLRRSAAPLEAQVRRLQNGSFSFETEGIGYPKDVLLRPFSEVSYDRYTVYWEVQTVPAPKDAVSSAGSGF